MPEKLPRELLKKIRQLELSSRKLVESHFSGEYHSVFKGQGIEFAEVRPYQHGDDVRAIDWNVTARFGEPYLKIFEETRELTVILVVDASASEDFGTREKFKSELSAELCANIAFSAIRNNDKVGLVIFSDHVELFIPPAKGRKHVLRLIREILFFKPTGRGTSITSALDRLNRTVNKRAIVFLISDFNDSGYEKVMRASASRHDLIAVEVRDPAEGELPDAGLITLVDSETGEEMIVDSSSDTFRERYKRAVHEKRARFTKFLRSCGIDRITVETDKPPVDPLVKFFKLRERRSARGI